MPNRALADESPSIAAGLRVFWRAAHQLEALFGASVCYQIHSFRYIHVILERIGTTTASQYHADGTFMNGNKQLPRIAGAPHGNRRSCAAMPDRQKSPFAEYRKDPK